MKISLIATSMIAFTGLSMAIAQANPVAAHLIVDQNPNNPALSPSQTPTPSVPNPSQPNVPNPSQPNTTNPQNTLPDPHHNMNKNNPSLSDQMPTQTNPQPQNPAEPAPVPSNMPQHSGPNSDMSNRS